MNRAEESINSPKDVSEEEANALATTLLMEIRNIEVYVAVKALVQLGAYRTDGVSFSGDVSNHISEWVNSIYELQNDNGKDNIIELIMELKSEVAVKLVNKLLPLTQKEHLKCSLYDAASCAGT